MRYTRVMVCSSAHLYRRFADHLLCAHLHAGVVSMRSPLAEVQANVNQASSKVWVHPWRLFDNMHAAHTM